MPNRPLRKDRLLKVAEREIGELTVEDEGPQSCAPIQGPDAAQEAAEVSDGFGVPLGHRVPI